MVIDSDAVESPMSLGNAEAGACGDSEILLATTGADLGKVDGATPGSDRTEALPTDCARIPQRLGRARIDAVSDAGASPGGVAIGLRLRSGDLEMFLRVGDLCRSD